MITFLKIIPFPPLPGSFKVKVSFKLQIRPSFKFILAFFSRLHKYEKEEKETRYNNNDNNNTPRL